MSERSELQCDRAVSPKAPLPATTPEVASQ